MRVWKGEVVGGGLIGRIGAGGTREIELKASKSRVFTASLIIAGSLRPSKD